MSWSNLENLYNNSCFPFLGFKASILKKAGNKYIPKGYNKDVEKLIIESLIR
jgi:hypothetical protein